MNAVNLLVSAGAEPSQTYLASADALGMGIHKPLITIALGPKSAPPEDELIVPVKIVRPMPGIRELSSPLSD